MSSVLIFLLIMIPIWLGVDDMVLAQLKKVKAAVSKSNVEQLAEQ